MTKALDHIAICVDDLEQAIGFYQPLIGQGAPILREVPELGLRLAFFIKQGGVALELVEAAEAPEMRHGDVVVALEVDDLPAEIARLASLGITAYHQKPTPNLPLHRGWIPKSGGHGTIIELVQTGEVAGFIDA